MNIEIARKILTVIYDESEQREQLLRVVHSLFPDIDFSVEEEGKRLLSTVSSYPHEGILMSAEHNGVKTIEMCRSIKSSKRINTPILILSENELSHEEKSAFLKAGADDFLVLTADHETIIARISMILKLSASVKELEYLTGHFEEQLKDRVFELKQRDEQFRQFADNINEVFWMSTPYGNEITYVSPAYEKIWGRSCQSLYDQPKTYFESIHEEDRERVRAHLGSMLYGSFDEEYRIIRPDGDIRWIRAQAFPVLDQFGKLSRIVGIADDITKRKQVELELVEERNRITSFLNISGSLIVGINRDMTVSIANKKTCEILEYNEQEIVGKSWFETFIPAEEREVVSQVFAKLMNGEIEPVEHFTNRILSKSGKITIVKWRNTYLHDNKGSIYATMSSGEIIGISMPGEGSSQVG